MRIRLPCRGPGPCRGRRSACTPAFVDRLDRLDYLLGDGARISAVDLLESGAHIDLRRPCVGTAHQQRAGGSDLRRAPVRHRSRTNQSDSTLAGTACITAAANSTIARTGSMSALNWSIRCKPTDSPGEPRRPR